MNRVITLDTQEAVDSFFRILENAENREPIEKIDNIEEFGKRGEKQLIEILRRNRND